MLGDPTGTHAICGMRVIMRLWWWCGVAGGVVAYAFEMLLIM
jgi:hypothetical protein